MILQDLSYNSPAFVVLLDQAKPSAGVVDLERAGIVESLYSTQSCFGPQSMLVLTEKGQRIAASRGWEVDRNVLEIPVGRFAYIDGSLSIKRYNGRPYAISFRYRYEPNFNAAFLISLGNATDWDTGDNMTLADEGKIFARTVQLQFDVSRGWWLTTDWHRLRTYQC